MRYQFENLVLDSDRRELARGTESIAVGPQVFDLLLHLVRNREHVVTKDDLFDAVWNGRIVSESTLTSHINAVRKAIGDSGEEQRLLRTIARKGYRFVSEVREAEASGGADAVRPTRHLCVILAADVAGYSRLMGADEDGTLTALTAHRRELIDPAVAGHAGRIVKTTGDGLLVEFASAIDAVRCGVDIQRGMADRNHAVPQDRRLAFRIGLNLGDVIVQNGDLYGDGVNVAARLEALAEPGGICLSAAAHEQVQGKIAGVQFEDLGELRVKNIARPVRAYRVVLGAAGPLASPSLPDRPSIAVLPFLNLSGDPGQEYFVDGVVEDIISALSRMRWLFVIARNSSFTYKGRVVDVKQVGRELGVRYILEGSLRKSANRVRITGQLVDATTGSTLWSERFESTLNDLFDLQDQMTTSLVGALAPNLVSAEIERARHKPTGSLDAYDYQLRAMERLHRGSREAIDEALVLFYKAIELDAQYAPAYGMAAWCHFWRKANGWLGDRPREIAEGARLARRAIELGMDDAVALTRGAHALAHLDGDLEGGIALLDRAKMLNPNFAAAWFLGGFLRIWHADHHGAIAHFTQAMRLSPLDPEMYRMQAGMAMAHLFAGRFDEASSWAEKSFRDLPTFLMAVAFTAASHALAGRIDEAQCAMRHLRQLDPALRISNLTDYIPIRSPRDLAVFSDGLRKAGLPE